MLRSILKGSKYKKQQTVSKSSDLIFYHSVYFTIVRDASGEDRHEGKVDSRGRHEKKLWYLVPRQSEALDTNLRHFPSRVIQKVQRDGDRGGYDDLQVFNFLNHLGSSSPRQHTHVCDKIRSLKITKIIIFIPNEPEICLSRPYPTALLSFIFSHSYQKY